MSGTTYSTQPRPHPHPLLRDGVPGNTVADDSGGGSVQLNEDLAIIIVL